LQAIKYAVLVGIPLDLLFGNYAFNEYRRYQSLTEAGNKWSMNPQHVALAFVMDTGVALAALFAWRFNNKHNVVRAVKTVASSRRPSPV